MQIRLPHKTNDSGRRKHRMKSSLWAPSTMEMRVQCLHCTRAPKGVPARRRDNNVAVSSTRTTGTVLARKQTKPGRMADQCNIQQGRLNTLGGATAPQMDQQQPTLRRHLTDKRQRHTLRYRENIKHDDSRGRLKGIKPRTTKAASTNKKN